MAGDAPIRAAAIAVNTKRTVVFISSPVFNVLTAMMPAQLSHDRRPAHTPIRAARSAAARALSTFPLLRPHTTPHRTATEYSEGDENHVAGKKDIHLRTV